MGDPHKNVWGGKNNSWGHKPKGNKQQNNNTTYRPTKLFNTLAGGALLFIAGAMGLSIITSGFEMLTGAKDAVDTVNEVRQAVTNQASNTSSELNTSSNSGSVPDNLMERTSIIDELDFDIEAEDVRDILEKIYETHIENNVNTDLDNLVLVDYEDVKTLKKYEKNITDKLNDYSTNVTFGVVCTTAESPVDMNDKIAELQTMISENIDLLSGSGFKKTLTSGKMNTPEINNFILTISFIQ